MLKMLLRKEGVVTEVTENGQLAVDLVLKDLNKYSLLLMDNAMPVMVRTTLYITNNLFVL